jgi:hypothetical protein
MPKNDRGQIIGIAGLIALVASWAAIWVAPLLLSPRWVPRVWLMTIVVALPCAVVAGVVAARMTSKWWYFLAGAGFLSAAFLLAGAGGWPTDGRGRIRAVGSDLFGGVPHPSVLRVRVLTLSLSPQIESMAGGTETRRPNFLQLVLICLGGWRVAHRSARWNSCSWF